MNYIQAMALADDVHRRLSPYCKRLEIAGSVRRRKDTPKDLEFVAIPSMVASGLFGDETEVDPGFCAAVNHWPKVLGEPTGKYTQRILAGGVKLDLFMADTENWGLMFAIRTGSARYSHDVLARRWVQLGYQSIQGRLTRQRVITPIREEEDLFALLGLPWLPPEQREVTDG